MPVTPIKPLGSALKYMAKKSVAVLGAGGDLGSTIFGSLQRSAARYSRTVSLLPRVPRAITATSIGPAKLLSSLSRFVLAYASENNIALTDFSSVETLNERLENYDHTILSTTYSLKLARVNPGTYEPPSNSGLTYEPLMEADAEEDIQPLSLTLKADPIEPDGGSLFHRALAADRSSKTCTYRL